MMSTEIILNDTIQVVSFTITEKLKKKGNYCISIDQVKEIRIVEDITKIPKSKPYVKGLMNLRGKIIPVIDVNSKMGFSETVVLPNSKQRILVTDVNNTLTGLLVDEVNEVIKISSKEIHDVPFNSFVDNSFFKGVIKINENMIVILDIEKFLNYSMDYVEKNIDIDSSNVIKTDLKNFEIHEITPEIDELIKQEINK